MESIKIEIINPKVRKLLQSLETLNLIKILEQTDKRKDFKELLNKLRSKSVDSPTYEEILKEVEVVRESRYEEKS